MEDYSLFFPDRTLEVLCEEPFVLNDDFRAFPLCSQERYMLENGFLQRFGRIAGLGDAGLQGEDQLVGIFLDDRVENFFFAPEVMVNGGFVKPT